MVVKSMVEIFADTSGWGHLIDKSQKYHSLAVSIYREARRQNHRFVTTNYILSELVALLTSPFRIPRSNAIDLIESLKTSPSVEIIHIDKKLDSQAWELLVQRQDKTWSLVDCSSFVIMQQRNILNALTTDHHFEQAGFVKLLKNV